MKTRSIIVSAVLGIAGTLFLTNCKKELPELKLSDNHRKDIVITEFPNCIAIGDSSAFMDYPQSEPGDDIWINDEPMDTEILYNGELEGSSDYDYHNPDNLKTPGGVYVPEDQDIAIRSTNIN